MTFGHTLLDPTTIVAVATPPGRGGIGVVRISGPAAFSITRHLLPKFSESQPRIAQYLILHDADGARIDDALVTAFLAPHSYSGEDVVEIGTHGSPVVLDWIVQQAIAAGATPARAGEFTERAFLLGRIDLTAAEAVRDLIDALTLGQAKLAAEQMGGSIAASTRPTKDALIALIASLEAGIDFAEDDIDTMPADQLVASINNLLPPLQSLLGSFTHGRLMREGLRLAIVGRPNAGKSSLFNRLLNQERAIVTATPGTTRDVIAERISLDGIPVELLDTAGLRETTDEAERIGVERSHQTLADADVVLLVVDGTAQDHPLEPAILESLASRPVLVAANKCDLPQWQPPHMQLNAEQNPSMTATSVRVSATTGEGIDDLRAHLLRLAHGSGQLNAGAATLTSLRQRDAVARSVAALEHARTAASASTPHEMLLLDLYEALHALDELTGQTTPDDVLSVIFSSFCIGK